ncbi:hypothetical protein FQ142_07365 [Microbacterium sp. ANT_H45B]|uniref:DUF6194 family protein n=1 Tax=Microbacterium sp. ANT_H45B TaxID=2597346 RepID=UPI0011EE6569|nr:DUF6194 family protein [Microbacterium sp. ANT_H45B]KAA0960705.1 hypothetical protein FQ142_07365 [Microbacterium sp. ANT_H45B]
MDMESIIRTVQTFEGATVFQPEPGSAYPEISWGDAYFYYAPDGVMPERTQPYGTIITKDYPDDASSNLDEHGRFRVNVNAGRGAVAQLPDGLDPASVDTFFPHPLYGAGGWISVINPTTTADQLMEWLRAAHDAARARTERRSAG